ncbi:MAG: tRNA (adenosine(37)-N6)-threonylcarbamoyltransferase complex transferase subunit TsaD [Patescibacteria group bacterium]|nr:tRNA (adenosine(37)-N6)-threonylcarbamoyltransferase complex transferase subunit TsaD [Patescibacteria group bacterium]
MKKAESIRILGIETSCDETSVALLDLNNEHLKIQKHYIATQIPIHARYGGVVPEIAARTHVAEVISLIEKTTGWKSDFDAVAVTQGPGLATALRVGLEAGKTLAWSFRKPLLPVNHLEGHLASAWLVPANRKNWKFPILFLLVSGGHTELVLMQDFCRYKVLGRTRDDAAGEAFDKTAKLLGLEYPGGPKLSQLASKGNPKTFDLPRPMIHDPSLDFSFSGLKTAVRYLIENEARKSKIEDVCASIQAAIVDVLVAKTVRAALKVKPKAVAVVGGVSANPLLKSELRKALRRQCPGIKLLAPAKGLFTDNGAMIAAAGLWQVMKKQKISDWKKLDAQPDLDL